MDVEAGKTDYAVTSQTLRVRDMPQSMRPREEFERMGAENVSDQVLLALLLRTGSRGMNVVDVSSRLLAAFGSLTALARASVREIQAIQSVGPVKAQIIKASMELAQRLSRESVGEKPLVTTPEQAAAVLREKARILHKEVFWALMLDAKNRLIGEPDRISEGTLTSSLVHPRELFKKALERSCASVILAHNHPSGDPTPSSEDIKVTRQLIEAGNVMGIKVLDHIVLGCRKHHADSDFISMREAGLIQFE